MCHSNAVIKKWFTRVVKIAARCIQVYQVEIHEKKKGHWSENNVDPDISFNEETKLVHCQTADCPMTAKYKHNILKHLKSCYSVNKNRRNVADNKICKACRKKFSKMSEIDLLNSFMLKIIMIVLYKMRSQGKEQKGHKRRNC